MTNMERMLQTKDLIERMPSEKVELLCLVLLLRREADGLDGRDFDDLMYQEHENIVSDILDEGERTAQKKG